LINRHRFEKHKGNVDIITEYWLTTNFPTGTSREHLLANKIDNFDIILKRDQISRVNEHCEFSKV